MFSFLLCQLRCRDPGVTLSFGAKSSSMCTAPISSSRIQLVPLTAPPTVQSLSVADMSWWQSRSPRSSRGPGSLRPVFGSTHQHFPLWPSRAGWHCLVWKSPFLSQLGMGMVKRSSWVRVLEASLSSARCSSARHGASAALASSLPMFLWLVALDGCRARVFCMQRLSCGLQRILLLLGCSGMISSCRSNAELSSSSLSSVQTPCPCISKCSGLSTPRGGKQRSPVPQRGE